MRDGLLVTAALALFTAAAAGCAGEPPEPEAVTALLDAIRCPPRESGFFFVDSTVPGLDPFDGYTDEARYRSFSSAIEASTVAGDALVVDAEDATVDSAELVVMGEQASRRYCAGPGSLVRDEYETKTCTSDELGSTCSGEDYFRVRVLMRGVRTGDDCERPVDGEITVCFAE